MANVLVLILVIYALVGAVFALAFVARGAERIDPAAHGAGWGFRLLMIPGAAALWPILAMKWRRAATGRHAS